MTSNVAQNTRPFFRFSGAGSGDETREPTPIRQNGGEYAGNHILSSITGEINSWRMRKNLRRMCAKHRDSSCYDNLWPICTIGSHDTAGGQGPRNRH